MTRCILVALLLLLAPLSASAQTINPGASGSGITSLTGDCTGTGPGATATTCTKTSGVAFGTSATVNTGTSGATIPLLNAANTFSAADIFSAAGAASTPGVTVSGAPFTGGSGTTTFPQFYVNSGTGPTTFSTNGTLIGGNGPSGFTGNLIDFHVNGAASAFSVSSAGAVTAGSTITSIGSLTAGAAQAIGWTGRDSFTSSGTGAMQMGGANAASPIAQTFSTQGSRGGTDTNVSGANLTIQSGLGTGNATGSTFTLSTPHAGSAGTTQQTANAQITLGDNSVIVNQIGTDSGKTDATVCEDTTTHQLYFGSGTAGACLGTSSARFKTVLGPLSAGLGEIMRLRPIVYRYKPGHGDSSHELYGFTAEDMQPVLPQLVGHDAQGRPSSADYVGIIPVLVRAVQEQQAEIEALKKQVADDHVVMAKLRDLPADLTLAHR